jgi:TonB family protein
MSALQKLTLLYLVNSVWQVPLIFAAAWAAAWVAARAARRAGPALEYRIWVAALVLQVVLPAFSVSSTSLFDAAWHLPWTHPQASTFNAHVTTLTGPGYAHGVLRLPAHLLTLIAVAYGCSLLYFAGRLSWGLWKTSCLLHTAEPVALSAAAQSSWSRCCRIFAVQDAQPLVSTAIAGPATVGIRRRVVLLPRDLQQTFSVEDLDAALAHEFAHMLRRDFAWNLLYELLSLPAAYHPLRWLTRARIAETREMLCDALAASAVAGPERYARSLLRLASLLLERTPDKTLHAIGILDANLLERRLMNLTRKTTAPTRLRRLAVTAACIALGSATCASALALRLKVAAPAAAQETTDTGATPKIASGIMAGSRTNFVPPVYPQAAKDAKISGTVLLHAIIGKDGTITSLKLVSGPPELAQSALDAVQHWTYKPYLLNGEPTEVETTITVNYSLSK